MKKLCWCVLLVFLVVCQKADADTRRKIIIDTDTGADDATALILAAKNNNIDLLGVTVLAGNVDLEQAAMNALMSLEMAGSDVSVYKGASENMSGHKIDAVSVFGYDGMGDADLIHPKGRAHDKDAIDFILETVRKYPNEVELVIIGPATNIAKAIERDPNTMKQVKMIWSMGTSGLGAGNASPVAEFNVYADPIAYKIMLDSGINITVIGLDVCDGEACWTGAQLERLEKKNDIGKFITKSFQKFIVFSANNGFDSIMNADTLAMMCALYPDFMKDTHEYHGSCITTPGETFGQVILYRKGFTYDTVHNDFDYNVTLVLEVDKANFFELYLSHI